MKLGRYAPSDAEREAAIVETEAEERAAEELEAARRRNVLAGATSAHYAALAGPTAVDLGLPQSTINTLSGARLAAGRSGLLYTPVYYTGPSGRDLVSSKKLLATARERVDGYMDSLQKDMEYRGLVPPTQSFQEAGFSAAQRLAEARKANGGYIPQDDDIYIGGSGRRGYIKQSELERIAQKRVDSQFEEIRRLADQRRAAMADGELDAGYVARTRAWQRLWREDLRADLSRKSMRVSS